MLLNVSTSALAATSLPCSSTPWTLLTATPSSKAMIARTSTISTRLKAASRRRERGNFHGVKSEMVELTAKTLMSFKIVSFRYEIASGAVR